MLNLKKLQLAAAVISCSLILSACSLYKSNSKNQTQTTQGTQTQTQSHESMDMVIGATVTMTDAGFEPDQAKLKSGEAIKWVNNSSKKIQIASDPHPVHTANKELTNGQFVLELAPGESVMANLQTKGSFGYHNHPNPGVRGKVTVE